MLKPILSQILLQGNSVGRVNYEWYR